MTSPRAQGPGAASPEGRATRTVHAILPATHRPLCGYEEELPASTEGETAVACPECMALLRSGLLGRRLGISRR